MRASWMQRPRNTGCEHTASSKKGGSEKAYSQGDNWRKENPECERHELGSSLPSSPRPFARFHIQAHTVLPRFSLAPSFRMEFTPCILKDSSNLWQPIDWQLLLSFLLVSHVCLLPTSGIKIVWGQNLCYIISLHIPQYQAQTWTQ